MRRTTLRVLHWIGMLASGFGLGWWLRVPNPIQITSRTGPTVQQIQRLSTLVTTRVETADVQETSLSGYSGGIRVALLVKGDFLLGVNLAEARFESMDQKKLSAVLWLPAPQVTSPRVDHDHTRLFQVESEGLWAVVPVDAGRSAVIEQAYAQAQQSVARTASDPFLIERSRSRAEQVIRAFFAALGWNVRIEWSS